MKFYILLCMTIVWFICLSVLTFQKGEDTVEVSGKVAETVEEVVETVQPEREVNRAELEKTIRSLAHPIGFFVLAVLLQLTVLSAPSVAAENHRRAVLFAFLGLFLWSIFSEMLKIPIPGRHCSEYDMACNVMGSVVGSIAVGMVWKRSAKDGG